MCKLSIIVPVYNSEKYLDKCIESILNQDMINFELILINDGSTDNSENICKRYAEIDNRILIINKINGGQSSARNLGLNIARGKYIGFVDSDDWINKGMFSTLINILEKENSDIAICNSMWIYNDRNEIKRVNDKLLIMDNFNGMKELITGEKFIDTVWDKIYKKDLWDEIRFPEGKIYEDTDTIYKVFSKAKKSIFINEVLYYYIQRDGSTVNKKVNSRFVDQLIAVDNMIDFINDKYLSLLPEVLNLYFNCILNWITKIERYEDKENKNNNMKILKKYLRKRKYNIIFNRYLKSGAKILLISLVINERLTRILYKIRYSIGEVVYD